MRGTWITIVLIMGAAFVPSSMADPCIDPFGKPPVTTQGQCTMTDPHVGLTASASQQGFHILVWVQDGATWILVELTCALTPPGTIDPQQPTVPTLVDCVVSGIDRMPNPMP